MPPAAARRMMNCRPPQTVRGPRRIAFAPALRGKAPRFRIRSAAFFARRLRRFFQVIFSKGTYNRKWYIVGRGAALPRAGHLLGPVAPAAASRTPQGPAVSAAPFLSAAKEIGERTPPKTNGFWNSFRPITATPQKGPRRIAPAPIPAAASTCRGKMPYPTAVEQCTSAWYVGAAAIRGLHAIRCTTMFGNLSRAWYAAAVFSAPQPRRKS